MDRLGPIQRGPGWALVLVRLAAVLVPLGLALAITLAATAGDVGE